MVNSLASASLFLVLLFVLFFSPDKARFCLRCTKPREMQVHVGLWMEHHCWWNYYPLASKRAELHIFAGLINNVGASSTLIGSLSTLKPIHSSALVDSTLAPWRLEVQNTG